MVLVLTKTTIQEEDQDLQKWSWTVLRPRPGLEANISDRHCCGCCFSSWSWWRLQQWTTKHHHSRLLLSPFCNRSHLLHSQYHELFTPTSLRYVRVFAVAIPSVVCNVGAPYSGVWSFRQYFFAAVYADHPLTSVQNFTEIVLGEPLRRKR